MPFEKTRSARPFVVRRYELIDLGGEFLDAAEGSATTGPLGNQSKPAFNLIEPRRIRRDEMQVTSADGAPATSD